MQRRFAIIGHRAPSSGKLNLNDLSGGSGRLDVLLRAVNSALFLSHGIRTDSHITLHLEGGPGPSRRIWFNGETLAGVRCDERSIAGQIKAILKRPAKPIGVFDQVTQGIFDTGGNLTTTLEDWKREDVTLYVLDAEGEPIENIEKSERIGFILSDDRIFTDEEQKLMAHLPRISLGKKWLQGHSCITIVHHFLDKKD
ncbi:MAG: tRNA (pseudouridine(54)-N(1))-methyltransferase TrmY [Euryarchaeota archaeon]|jgi:tRNA (pseudouridine54-N1)-methyltransferase|nr:tRNA (pseudouridine(54)-N(1))-methyltransferase TrmY [Euryarchaeota archaeon]MBT6853737.1 tRNA (pseudouridine(54)-N(1))-methyltransferase TrmY [Euryarchaeota archaeon]|tara:strand:- start:13 stop:606 length:594 start_codon:yes stop_codon:yes gene_type:complete